MSAKDMLKGVIKGVAGEGRITDILNRVVDALAGDELQELSDGNMDELIKAIEEKSGVENMIKAVGFDELSNDDKKVAVAVLLKAARGAGAVIPDVEGLTKELADANAQIASLNEQLQKRESEFQGKEDEGWFNALIKAGKADPVEREAAMASLAEARKADALVKGGTSAMVKVIKATYDARVPQSDTKLADDAVEKLVKAGKVVSHNTQAGKEEEALKKRIAQETNSMLSASPEGRQAMATKKAEA